MAKQARGHRANKANDSFGTTNNPNLYRNKYKDDVYADDEDETPEVEATEDTEEATPQVAKETGDSFAPKKEASEDHDYKKRYDDLKRHYDEKIAEFKGEREELAAQLKAIKERSYEMPRGVTPPKTLEELAEFKERYPDVFEVVETVSTLQAETHISKLREELDVIKEREKKLEKDKAYEELLRLHPDFNELKSNDKFLAWLDEQPESLSDGIYKNNTNAKLAARVIDLYKADVGISTKKSSKTSKTADAAAAVTKAQPKEVATKETGGKIWKASQIAKLKPWEFEKLEEELDTARAEGRIDFRN